MKYNYNAISFLPNEHYIKSNILGMNLEKLEI